MSDRTALQAIIYACPPEAVEAVLDALEQFDLSADSGQEGLGRGTCYLGTEVEVGCANRLAQLLPDAATWKVWEDPKYEWFGELICHEPELGTFAAECDSYGQPVFTPREVKQMHAAAHDDPARLDALTGLTWQNRFDEIARTLEVHGDAASPSPAEDASPPTSPSGTVGLQRAAVESPTGPSPNTPLEDGGPSGPRASSR